MFHSTIVFRKGNRGHSKGCLNALFILCSVLGLLTKRQFAFALIFKPQHNAFRLAIDKIQLAMNWNK